MIPPFRNTALHRIGAFAAGLVILGGWAFVPGAGAAETRDLQRGQLLYETQCSACHSAQAHWRDKRVVKSWRALIAEVGRWQSTSGQNWSDAEIEDVASYLNGLYYKLPCATPGCQGSRAAQRKGTKPLS